MTPAAAFLGDLRARGVALRGEGDRLYARGVLTTQDRTQLVGLKPELLATLRAEAAAITVAEVARLFDARMVSGTRMGLRRLRLQRVAARGAGGLGRVPPVRREVPAAGCARMAGRGGRRLRRAVLSTRGFGARPPRGAGGGALGPRCWPGCARSGRRARGATSDRSLPAGAVRRLHRVAVEVGQPLRHRDSLTDQTYNP